MLSNLNRHAKKCAQRSGHQEEPTQDDSTEGPASGGAPAPATIALEAGPSTDPAPAPASHLASHPSEQTRGRKRKAPMSIDAAEDQAIASTPKKERRPRRKRSQSRWVPDSLKLYDLAPVGKATPLPLPPVRPFLDSNGKVLEERDSYSSDASENPYHPLGWIGRLPGPGLMDTSGSLASSGRLLVF